MEKLPAFFFTTLLYRDIVQGCQTIGAKKRGQRFNGPATNGQQFAGDKKCPDGSVGIEISPHF